MITKSCPSEKQTNGVGGVHKPITSIKGEPMDCKTEMGLDCEVISKIDNSALDVLT